MSYPKKLILVASLLIVIFFVVFVWYIRKYQIVPDSGYHLLDEINPPASHDRVVVFSPHPDDETLGAAGFITQSVAIGAQIKIIIVSDGNKHRLKIKRHQETLQAMAILGVNQSQVEFLDLADGKISSYSDLSDRLNQALGDFKPTVILTPHSADRHPDHSAVGNAVKQLLATHPEIQATIYNYLVHYPRYPRPIGEHPTFHLLPPPQLITSDNQWYKLTLTPTEQQKKHQAILEYKTQLTLKNPPLRSLLLDFDRKNELFAHE